MEPADATFDATLARSSTVSVRGTVRSHEERRGIEGAEIWTCPSGNPERAQRVGVSDAAGRFEVAGLAPRTWITARRVGAVTDHWFPLDTPGVQGLLEVDLALRTDAVRCRGRVVDDRGVAVPGALVRTMRHRVEELGAFLSADGQWRVESSFCSRTETRHDGTFELALHPQRRLFLIVEAEGFAPQATTVAAHSGLEVTCDLRLDRGRSIFGVARDQQGRALPGAWVELCYDTRFASYEARTDASGAFELHGLPNGQASLHLRGGGSDAHLAWRRSVLVDETLPREIAAELGPGAAVLGRARDERGQPLVGATVLLRGYATKRGLYDPPEALPSNLDGRRAQDCRTKTDSDGRFRFNVLTADLRDLLLLSDDETTVLARVPDPALEVEIPLDASTPSAFLYGSLGHFPSAHAEEAELRLSSPSCFPIKPAPRAPMDVFPSVLYPPASTSSSTGQGARLRSC